jgi:hypothetical protein
LGFGLWVFGFRFTVEGLRFKAPGSGVAEVVIVGLGVGEVVVVDPGVVKGKGGWETFWASRRPMNTNVETVWGLELGVHS